MIEEIREEIQAKIRWLEWNNHPRSLELIDWLNSLLKKLPEEKKVEVVEKKVEVELPKEEVEKPKKKILFKKK